MMRTTIFALSLMMVAAPAAAANTTADKGAETSQGATATKAEDRKYCFRMDDIVGSRVRAKMDCKTKADWARRGVDVDRVEKE